MPISPLEEAHRVFDLEESYLAGVIESDPTMAGLARRLGMFQKKIEGRLGDRFLEVYRDLDTIHRRLLAEMMFKLGYLYAKTYPTEEVLAPARR